MSSKQKIHFIGIGGIGMSAIARMYSAMGHRVQGSDMRESDLLLKLEEEGAKVFVNHDASHVNGADLVIYSSSIGPKHPERQAALKKGIRLIHRAEALAELCQGKFTIAVSGTHGKTTTTALVGMILKEAGRDPSIVVGGLVNSFGGNACYGQGCEIVIEADESDSSFLHFSPDLEVITNIENEHMDHFKTAKNIEAAYQKFIRRLPDHAVWFGCAEDDTVMKLAKENSREAVLYGFQPSKKGITATDIIECPNGRRGVSFIAWAYGKRLGPVELNLLGRHNVLNALAALGVGLRIGISFQTIQEAFQKYKGAGRRFEVKYEDPQFLIVDDYAHHPTEIRKTLMAAKALQRPRIVALFQPHRYTRTQTLLKEFGSSFADADKLVVTDVYAASETPLPGISGDRLCEEVRNSGHRDVTFIERSKVADYLHHHIQPGDLVMILGAGDINQVAAQLSDSLRTQELFKTVRGKIFKDEPLSRHTSLKVGGPAKFWIEPEDADDLKLVLKECKTRALPIYLFGAGSNVLPPDHGLEGVVIHLASEYFRRLWTENGKIMARAGVPNSLFIQYALENGYGGCEFLLGIPGSIGGSIAMNAGSHQQSVDLFLGSVRVIDLNGEESLLEKHQIPFSYRSSGLEKRVIVEGAFEFPVEDRRISQRRLEEYRDHRFKTQDLQHPSAGCMFKNTSGSDCSSGQLIEDAGLKGRTIGKAQVSTKHANFIINLGGASSGDVLALIQEVKEVVKKKFHVELETEVKIL